MRLALPGAAVVLIAVLFGGSVAGAESTGPTGATVQVSPASAAPGDDVVVQLADWPLGPALVSVCGNNALRGSQDCNLAGTKGVAVRSGGATLRFRVSAPPIHCPCVIRATSANGEFVRQAPFGVDGQPTGPEVLPITTAVPAKSVPVRAHLEDADDGVMSELSALMAGPVHKTLVVTVRNDSAQPVEGLRVVGAIGHKRSDAEPIESATVEQLAPGKTATVRIPVRIGVPAWGDYKIVGSVYGLSVPGHFTTTTTNDPWGLEVALPLALLVLAWFARRREVRDEALEEMNLLPEDSPPVGIADDDRSLAPSYAPPHALAS